MVASAGHRGHESLNFGLSTTAIHLSTFLQRRVNMTETPGKQLLHLVFGGELEDLDSYDFKDLSKLDIVGIFPNYATAHAAWKAGRRRPWTTRRCAISSSTCIACSIPSRPERSPVGSSNASRARDSCRKPWAFWSRAI